MRTIRFMSLALMLAVVANVAWPSVVSAEGDSARSQVTKTIILVRHAEKCSEPAGDPELTSLGLERADALRRTLTDVGVEAMYSTPLKRTLQTVQGLAEDHGLETIETPIAAGFLERLAETILSSAESVVVVSGHSNTTTRMVNLLAGTEYPDLDESEYDRLFIVHIPTSGSPEVTALRYGPPSGPSSSPC